MTKLPKHKPQFTAWFPFPQILTGLHPVVDAVDNGTE